MRSPRTVFALALLLGAAACGSGNNAQSTADAVAAARASQRADDAAAAQAQADAEQEAAADPATSSPVTPVSGIGRTYIEHGATAVVKAAKIAKSIPYAGRVKSAGPGAEFALITVKITNHSHVGMDLTCSLSVATNLISDEDQHYEDLDLSGDGNLYDYPGNPECNADLQPGFTSTMTWVYRIPAGTHIIGWGFSDATRADYDIEGAVIVPLELR